MLQFGGKIASIRVINLFIIHLDNTMCSANSKSQRLFATYLLIINVIFCDKFHTFTKTLNNLFEFIVSGKLMVFGVN